MKHILTTILFLCIFSSIHAQLEDCTDCPCIIELGDKHSQKREYADAIDMYNAATACDVNLKDEANGKIKIVFKKIENERDNAIAAEKRAVKAEEEAKRALIIAEQAKEEAKEALEQAQISKQKAIGERNKAKMAEEKAKTSEQNAIEEKNRAKTAEGKAEEQSGIAKDKTENLQTVLDALYFYEDSLALAYDGYDFGFINKKGDLLIDYKYDEALPFDDRGYAKVKRNGTDYLIDTKGIEYRWTDDVNKLDENIKAFGSRGKPRCKKINKILKNKQLNILTVGGCRIKYFPSQMEQLTNLQSLELTSNYFTFLPAEIGRLTNLQILDLGSNELSELPPEIGQLKQLQILELSNNQLSELPPEIGQLGQLQILDLGGIQFSFRFSRINKLRILPPEIGQLKQLQILELSNNQLSELPPEIGQLGQLQILELKDNRLTSLPSEIGQLKNLQTLNLWGNDLTPLPVEIRQLTSLQTLNLRNTNLSKEEKQKIKKLLPNCDIEF